MSTVDVAALVGRPGSPGIGVGRSLLVGSAGAGRVGAGAEAEATVAYAAAADPAEEADRLRTALETASAELTALAASTTESAGEEVGAIFEAQALFAHDPGIVDPALALVASGRPADEAIIEVAEQQADVLAAVDDEYFRERAADVRDVGKRIASIVRGETRPDLWHADGSLAILVGEDLDPSAVAALRPELTAGIALGGGAPTSHAAIVARALGLPLVIGLGESLTAIRAGVEVLVDGSVGRVYVAPSAELVASLRAGTGGAGAAAGSTTGSGAEATHGVKVEANVASPLEAEAAAAAGADGVGLVRTELLFLGRRRPPLVGEQRATYARIQAALGGAPVTFRTLDIGGDKPASWQTGPAEMNPALGVRGVRLGQRIPSLLDDQLRALVEATAGQELRVMIPMLATVEELEAVRARLDAIVGSVVADGAAAPSSIELGIMIEVPSAAVMADALARTAAFFSIGTNDLVQYTMAVDRTNPELADMASPLQPAVLRLIDGVVRAAARYDRPVAVCGEAAADPSVVPFLVGLGIRELSVTPSSIARVRSVVAERSIAACRALAARALEAGTLAEVRSLLG